MTYPALFIASFALGACATVPADDGRGDYPVREPVSDCVDGEAQAHVGQRASSEIGQHLLTITGARVLRWVPPDTVVTMDYRADRLTVSYDRNMVITRISCG